MILEKNSRFLKVQITFFKDSLRALKLKIFYYLPLIN